MPERLLNWYRRPVGMSTVQEVAIPNVQIVWFTRVMRLPPWMTRLVQLEVLCEQQLRHCFLATDYFNGKTEAESGMLLAKLSHALKVPATAERELRK